MATVVVDADTDAHYSDVDSSERAIVHQLTQKGLVLLAIPAKVELGDTSQES